jgi:hypothetical protein
MQHEINSAARQFFLVCRRPASGLSFVATVRYFESVTTRQIEPLEKDMNHRKISIKSALPVAVALLAFAAAPAGADEVDSKPTVTFITDAAQGKAISKEQYDLAVEKLEKTHARGIDSFYVANNLCISYLKIGEVEKAQESCDIALARIEKLIKVSGRGSVYSPSYDKLLDIAIANRSVVYAINNNSELTSPAA